MIIRMYFEKISRYVVVEYRLDLIILDIKILFIVCYVLSVI